jgi:molybdate-binding protein
MVSARDLARSLGDRVAVGQLSEGDALPSQRALAREVGTSTATVARAYALLVEAGILESGQRRLARVAADGELAAQRMLRGGRPFRLAGSDDPALDLLAQSCSDVIETVPAGGSVAGFTALWKGRADGAAVHLLHRDGTYNAPYLAAILAERDPVLVHLWSREQGIVVAAGNPLAIAGVADLDGLRLARRPAGSGTRVLEERLLAAADASAGAGSNEVPGHLDVGFAVAAGSADAGIGVRAAAQALGLEFVALAWEPFEIATTAAQLGGVEPLLRALRRPEIRARIDALGGYDLRRAGSVRRP